MKFVPYKLTNEFDEFRVYKDPFAGWEIVLLKDREIVKEIQPDTVDEMKMVVEDILKGAINNLPIEV